MYANGDILGTRLLAETIFPRIKHTRWLILRDITLFIVYFDLMVRI
jgi:hypothetical protein